MDDIADELIEEILRRLAESASDIELDEIISSAQNMIFDSLSNLSDIHILSDEIKENLINSIVEHIGGNHETIAENLEIISNINADSFSGVDSDSFTLINDDLSQDSISFCGNNDNADAIKFQEEKLKEATHNIDYYEKEIRNFNENTTETYRSKCISRLQQATAQAKEAENKIQNLKR